MVVMPPRSVVFIVVVLWEVSVTYAYNVTNVDTDARNSYTHLHIAAY